MARPEFPTGCVLPVQTIHRINAEQSWYDKDTSRAERIYKQREEQRSMEKEEERQEQTRQERIWEEKQEG
jgi:hypothetical protein